MALRQRSWRSKPFQEVILLTALLFSMLFAAAAKGGKTKSKGKKGPEIGMERYAYAFTIIKVTIILTISPAIILFIYSVVNDPDTPKVLKALWKLAKMKGLRNITSSNQTKQDEDFYHTGDAINALNVKAN